MRYLIAVLLALALATVALAGGVVGYADQAPDGTLSNFRRAAEGAKASDPPHTPGDVVVALSAMPSVPGPWTYDAASQTAVPVRTGKADGSAAGTKAALATAWLAELEAAETAKSGATAALARLVTAKASADVLTASQARIDAAEARASAVSAKLAGL